jgi:hypothetical protein
MTAPSSAGLGAGALALTDGILAGSTPTSRDSLAHE